MTSEEPRHCLSCEDPLPEGSRTTRRYCDNQCRQRAKRQRSRPAQTGRPSNAANWHMEQLRKELSSARRSLRQITETSEKRAARIIQLERQLANRDRYIQEQAERNARANADAAALRIDLDLLRTEHEALTDLDPVEFHENRKKLQEARRAYRDIRDRIEGAAREREGLQNVVRQWDRLCKRLNEQTNGKPRTERDQEILATWKDFRAKQGKHTP